VSAPAPPPAGLCDACRHAERVASKRSVFLRCALSDTDPRFPRYPRLPVLECAGYEPGGGGDGGVSSRGSLRARRRSR
jgi:hypothetical protein